MSSEGHPSEAASQPGTPEGDTFAIPTGLENNIDPPAKQAARRPKFHDDYARKASLFAGGTGQSFRNKEAPEVLLMRRILARLEKHCKLLSQVGDELIDVKPADLGKRKAAEWGRDLHDLASDFMDVGAEIGRLTSKRESNAPPPTIVRRYSVKPPAAEPPPQTTEPTPFPQSVVQSVLSSFHHMLQALCHHTGAERGAVYAPTPEGSLVAVVMHGYGSTRPGELRSELNDTLVGMCYQTKIGMPSDTGCNFQYRKGTDPKGDSQGQANAYRIFSSLVMPILVKESAGKGGVLQLVNKSGGVGSFIDEDETMAHRTTQLMGMVLQLYPCANLHSHPLDARFLHTMQEQPPYLGMQYNAFNSLTAKQPQLMMHVEAGARRGGGGIVMYAQDGHRTIKTGSDLVDVAEYVKWLEQAWKAAVELNREYQRQLGIRGSTARLLVTRLNKKVESARKEAILYRELLDMRNRGAHRIHDDYAEYDEEDDASCPPSPQPQGGKTSAADWKLGDVTFIADDATYIEYCYELAMMPFRGRYADLAGVAGTVVGVEEDHLRVRCAAKGRIQRGDEVCVPYPAVRGKAGSATHLAHFLRRPTLQGDAALPSNPGVYSQSQPSQRRSSTKQPRRRSSTQRPLSASEGVLPDYSPAPPGSGVFPDISDAGGVGEGEGVGGGGAFPRSALSRERSQSVKRVSVVLPSAADDEVEAGVEREEVEGV